MLMELDLFTISTQASLVLRASALLLLIIKVLPIQYREMSYANGLKFYRTILFVLGCSVTISILLGMLVVTNRTFWNPIGIHRDTISLIYSVGDFLIALFLYLIYNKGGESTK